MDTWSIMAVASGAAGPVLAGRVHDVPAFKTAHAQTINNQVKDHRSLAHSSPVQNLDYPKYETSIIGTLRLSPCVYAYVNKQPRLFELWV